MFDCDDLVTNDEAARCILPVKNSPDEKRCEICEFRINTNVNVSCVGIIPVNDQPTSSDMDVVEREIEEFAGKLFDGMYIMSISLGCGLQTAKFWLLEVVCLYIRLAFCSRFCTI